MDSRTNRWCKQLHINYLSTLFPFFTGCDNSSLYGSNCDKPCPTNCNDGTCHIQNGTCFYCKPGWTGMYCNASKMTNFIWILHFSYFFPFQLNLNTLLQQYLKINILFFFSEKQDVMKDCMVINVFISV